MVGVINPFEGHYVDRYKELRQEEGRLSSIVVEHEEDVADYFELRNKLDEFAADFKAVITHPSYSLPFLQPGRLVVVKHLQLDFGWGVVINYQKRLPPKVNYVLFVLWHRN